MRSRTNAHATDAVLDNNARAPRWQHQEGTGLVYSDNMTIARRKAVACAVALAVATAAAAGCNRAEGRTWGEAVDPAEAVPLSELLSADVFDDALAVTAAGRIGEVCRAAGCWFVLQDTSGAKVHEILIDLKPLADFVVPADVQGYQALVRGRFVGSKPDLKFHAVGLRLE